MNARAGRDGTSDEEAHMDAVPVLGDGEDGLLALVDFKWLTAGQVSCPGGNWH